MSFVLITGASKGIGKAIAEEFAIRKFNVLLVARSEDELSSISQFLKTNYSIQADYFVTDLAKTDAPTQLFDWVVKNQYQVNTLVNNAGYGLSGSFEKYTVAENLEMMQLNMLTLVQLTQLFLPQLRKQNKSYIMNIASTASYQAVPGLSLYAATKSFVLSFSRGLRQELKSTTVSVTCISPGATDTGFATRAQVGAKGLKAAEKVNMTPQQVAHIAVKSMLSGKAEVITGAINKLGAFMAWALPKSLVESVAGNVYK